MINIRKPEKNPVMIIRAASSYEFSLYEKNKLANIEDNAQVNVLEKIKINDESLPIKDKTVNIPLGKLAMEDQVRPKDITADELFLISCVLTDQEE